MRERFMNRSQAGRLLAARLVDYAGRKNVRVLALPRGGVPVGFEVARALGTSLDILVTRKLSVPGQKDVVIGAIAAGDVIEINAALVQEMEIPEAVLNAMIAGERQALARREAAYRSGGTPEDLASHTVILVDDGMQTGMTMRAAITAVRRRAAAHVVVAVPVAAEGTCQELRTLADQVICVSSPASLSSVWQWYAEFAQVTDEEIRDLLRQANPTMAGVAA